MGDIQSEPPEPTPEQELEYYKTQLSTAHQTVSDLEKRLAEAKAFAIEKACLPQPYQSVIADLEKKVGELENGIRKAVQIAERLTHPFSSDEGDIWLHELLQNLLNQLST